MLLAFSLFLYIILFFLKKKCSFWLNFLLFFICLFNHTFLILFLRSVSTFHLCFSPSFSFFISFPSYTWYRCALHWILYRFPLDFYSSFFCFLLSKMFSLLNVLIYVYFILFPNYFIYLFLYLFSVVFISFIFPIFLFCVLFLHYFSFILLSSFAFRFFSAFFHSKFSFSSALHSFHFRIFFLFILFLLFYHPFAFQSYSAFFLFIIYFFSFISLNFLDLLGLFSFVFFFFFLYLFSPPFNSYVFYFFFNNFFLLGFIFLFWHYRDFFSYLR